ncbi:uncharacterized protein M6B38_353660 [Iris pallida]|uniref:Uncharacterized protein n=1 Tax=Iris pallida TaxID=29817 RepID=A0AAX6GP03_IRIPA|nr:uncharacterized protein M6B38_404535 [Iris pallida]KAJ6830304.1 uncharacterized protein M6B38_353660 [Iris pallida]
MGNSGAPFEAATAIGVDTLTEGAGILTELLERGFTKQSYSSLPISSFRSKSHLSLSDLTIDS